jgi:hypothetical protein
MAADISSGKRPSCPTDPSQTQWLQERIWDVITTCWSDKPKQRYNLSIVHYIFSTLGRQDLFIESPPGSYNNLIHLVGELLCTSLILPLDPNGLAALRTVQECISKTSLSSVEVVALVETFHEVFFSCQNSPQSLKPLVIRPYWICHPLYGVPCLACGTDFIPTPSSLDQKSSPM